MIRAVIFDYFGVIRTTGLRAAYTQLGGDLSRDEAFVTDVTVAANYGFITDADEQLAERLGVDLPTWKEAVSGAHGNDTVLLAYIANDLRAQKHLATGLLSNAGAQAADDYFQPGEIEQYFDVALVSGETGFVKPEAAFYRMRAERLGVSPEHCVMVDDRKEFCDGAVRVGMQAIEYRHFEQFEADLEKLLSDS